MSTLKERFCTICLVSEKSTEFQKRTSCCKSCYKKKQKQWNDNYYKKNKEKIIKKARENYNKNPEDSRKKLRERYYRNKEKNLEYKKIKEVRERNLKLNRIRYANNPEYRKKVLERHKQYILTDKGKESVKISRDKRKRNLKEVFLISSKDLKKLKNSDCYICGSKDSTIDHIIPIYRGGRHSIGNLQALCRSCNSSKGTKLMVEWIKKGTKNVNA